MESLYDYSPVEKGCYDLCRDIQNRISHGDCCLVDLSAESDDTGQTPVIFEEKAGTFWTRQYIGLFEYQGHRIFICSRFDRGNPEPFFLWYLIGHFLGESIVTLDDIGSTDQNDFFDGLLALRLAIQIRRAQKHGGLRAYRSFARNDSQVRGVIDIPRHIRENMEQDNGRIAYRTQTYSLDNDWNVLFLHATHAAGRRCPDLMRRLQRRLPEYTSALRIIEQAVSNRETPGVRQVLARTERKITNPVYQNWEPARVAARDILRRTESAPGENRASIVTGVFLDSGFLWERLLEDRLFAGAKKPFTQQSRDVLDGHLTIRPDFYFSSQGTVLDAKYRPVWEKTLAVANGRWSRSLDASGSADVRENIYQVFGYMLALDCSEGGVIFPAHSLRNPAADRIDPSDRRFWRIPVCIPQAADYPAFRDALEKEFCRLRTLAPVSRIVT